MAGRILITSSGAPIIVVAAPEHDSPSERNRKTYLQYALDHPEDFAALERWLLKGEREEAAR